MQACLSALRSRGVQLETVIDVGAHHGEWCTAVTAVFPQARTLSIEANEECACELSKRTNRYRIACLSNVAGKARFHKTTSDSSTGNSLFREKTMHYDYKRGIDVDINTTTLDDLLASEPDFADGTIDMLKLDVQGAELLVLEGGPNALRRSTFVLLEVSLFQYNHNAPLFADVVAFMHCRGFQAYDIADRHDIQGFLWQCDVLFVSDTSHHVPRWEGGMARAHSSPLQDVRLSSGDRSQLLERLHARKATAPFSVIDVGGTMGNWTKDVADAYADILTPTHAPDMFFRVDLNDPDTWGTLLDHVKTHGKFDFSICSHTLEDIASPRLAIRLLMAVSVSGYIAVPSKHRELCRFERGPHAYRGYIHHRYIFVIDRGELVAYPKINVLDHMPIMDRVADADPDKMDLSFMWHGNIPFREVNNGYLGPTVDDVIAAYAALACDS